MTRRCVLFIPGNNPRNLIGGSLYGADSLVLDLEDAVLPQEKDAARILVRNALDELAFGTEIIVRINSIGSPYWREDLAAVIPKGVNVVMLPKTSSPQDIKTVSEEIGRLESQLGITAGAVRLIALLESVKGIEAAASIACCDRRIDSLYLGAEDLAVDLGARRTSSGEEILYSRAKIVSAARLAGIQALDTPFLDIKDEEGLRRDCRTARNMGFDGKAAIYPLQVEAIVNSFTPSAEEYLAAKNILEAISTSTKNGRGVTTFGGKLVDGPILLRAKRTVEQYKGGASN